MQKNVNIIINRNGAEIWKLSWFDPILIANCYQLLMLISVMQKLSDLVEFVQTDLLSNH